ncbi:MAG TPA: inositol monophosphatase family protein [Pseudolysinimonas sp.]|nr:inositol monophosphatase family protein [Pseudolysinimonas sp.]
MTFPASAPSLADDLALALALAADADLIAIDRYRAQDLDVQLKPDRTHVTDADTRVETVIREELARARPGDAILGEEFGGSIGGSSNAGIGTGIAAGSTANVDAGTTDGATPSRVWIIDPIDGTSNFVRGVPIWGALISLVIDGVPQVGVVSAPALGRRWWGATGHGAWVQVGTEAARRIRVSGVDNLADATLSYNSLKGWDDAGRSPQLLALSRAVGRTRAFGDLWSYMLVAEGAIDVAGEFDVKPWDIAALVPIVREAGGRASDADGVETLESGSVLVSNGILHDRVLSLIASDQSS